MRIVSVTDFHLLVLILDGLGVKLLLTGLRSSRAQKESSKKSLVVLPCSQDSHEGRWPSLSGQTIANNQSCDSTLFDASK